jgi:limonene-1,2-epoxide hydrolase
MRVLRRRPRGWCRSAPRRHLKCGPGFGPPGIESIEFRVISLAADGPVVMTERVDVFRLPDKSFELQVMGTFEVTDGKINAWRDYFDMNQFTSRMG